MLYFKYHTKKPVKTQEEAKKTAEEFLRKEREEMEISGMVQKTVQENPDAFDGLGQLLDSLGQNQDIHIPENHKELIEFTKQLIKDGKISKIKLNTKKEKIIAHIKKELNIED